MNTIESIQARRSIRKFVDRPLSRNEVETILEAGIAAPSAKNRQPWRFVVVTETERASMLAAMRAGLDWMDQHGSADASSRMLVQGARYTLSIMEKAPVTIFVLNPEGKSPFVGLEAISERFSELANIQSVGACIQNMCLAATDLGLGSLWICDVFSAYPPLVEWLGTEAQMVAALSVGLADEAPEKRPRKSLSEVTTWR